MGKIRAYTVNTEHPLYQIAELTSELESLQSFFPLVKLVHFRNLFAVETQLKLVSAVVEKLKTNEPFRRAVNIGLMTLPEIALSVEVEPGDNWCDCEQCN
jgi:hypothetical protein